MSSQQTLQLAIELAQRRCDEAARQLQTAEDACAQASAQLQQLTGYQAETGQRWLLKGQMGMLQPVVAQHYRFMDKLADVIVMQTEVVRKRQLWRDRQQQLWTQAQQRLEILRRYLDRQAELRRQHLERIEQKNMDELAAIRFRANANPTRSVSK